MSIIQVNRLTKDYGKHKGVFDLSFALERGETFGILGPNGAGKTTTLRCLMGFIHPDSGECGINYMDCCKDHAKIQKILGYLPGETAFPEHMTGENYLRFMAQMRGMNSFARAEELMRLFELDGQTKIRRMSKGMRQKTALICALMHEPNVLLLDEPTDGLDPLMKSRFVDLLCAEHEKGTSILISSHSFDEIERTCGRVGIIKSGRMAAIDDVETMKRTQLKTYRVFFDTADSAKAFHDKYKQEEDKLPVAGESIFHTTMLAGNSVTVTVQNNLHPLLDAVNQFPVTDIESFGQTLESAFMHYYGGEDK